jgi:hypothetical protein
MLSYETFATVWTGENRRNTINTLNERMNELGFNIEFDIFPEEFFDDASYLSPRRSDDLHWSGPLRISGVVSFMANRIDTNTVVLLQEWNTHLLRSLMDDELVQCIVAQGREYAPYYINTNLVKRYNERGMGIEAENNWFIIPTLFHTEHESIPAVLIHDDYINKLGRDVRTMSDYVELLQLIGKSDTGVEPGIYPYSIGLFRFMPFELWLPEYGFRDMGEGRHMLWYIDSQRYVPTVNIPEAVESFDRMIELHETGLLNIESMIQSFNSLGNYPTILINSQDYLHNRVATFTEEGDVRLSAFNAGNYHMNILYNDHRLPVNDKDNVQLRNYAYIIGCCFTDMKTPTISSTNTVGCHFWVRPIQYPRHRSCVCCLRRLNALSIPQCLLTCLRTIYRN